MIRLSIEKPLVLECATVEEAIAALRTLATLPGQAVNASPRPVNVALPVVNDHPRPVPPAAVPVNAPKPRGAMKPTGKKKTCQRCKASFPVLDRSDCASRFCRPCRPTPLPRKNPKVPIPAAGQLGRTPIHPDEPKAKCRTCGDVVRAHECINGECLDCAPLAARKATA